MMNTIRIANVFAAIRDEIENCRIKHVQLIFKIQNHRATIKFVSVDNEHYKSAVKKICNKYCEDLRLINETLTTLTYEM